MLLDGRQDEGPADLARSVKLLACISRQKAAFMTSCSIDVLFYALVYSHAVDTCHQLWHFAATRMPEVRLAMESCAGTGKEHNDRSVAS